MIRVRNHWILPVSVVLALLLGLLPLPAALQPLRPYWLALVLAFWVLEDSERVGDQAEPLVARIFERPERKLDASVVAAVRLDLERVEELAVPEQELERGAAQEAGGHLQPGGRAALDVVDPHRSAVAHDQRRLRLCVAPAHATGLREGDPSALDVSIHQRLATEAGRAALLLEIGCEVANPVVPGLDAGGRLGAGLRRTALDRRAIVAGTRRQGRAAHGKSHAEAATQPRVAYSFQKPHPRLRSRPGAHGPTPSRFRLPRSAWAAAPRAPSSRSADRSCLRAPSAR